MSWHYAARLNGCLFQKWMTTKSSSGITSVQTWLTNSHQRAIRVSDSALADLRVLLADRLQVTTTWVAAHPEIEIPHDQLSQLETNLALYLNGTPLPYILGRVDFYGHEFFVSADVLIPRPETELLVEKASDWLKGHPDFQCGVDVGTGTGCIPVSLAYVHPGLKITAVDISLRALQVSARNISRYGLIDRIHLVQADLLASLDISNCHLITANLPYIPSLVLNELVVAKHEPVLALDGGPDGVDLIRILFQQLSGWLVKPFCILLEMEYRQTEVIRKMANNWFPTDYFQVYPDLAGLPRLIEIRGEA